MMILLIWLSVLILFVLCITIPANKALLNDRDLIGTILMLFCNASLLAIFGMFVIILLEEFKIL